MSTLDIIIIHIVVCLYVGTFIGHHLKKAIERAGAKSVMAVVLDGGGDWSATEEMIKGFSRGSPFYIIVYRIRST